MFLGSRLNPAPSRNVDNDEGPRGEPPERKERLSELIGRAEELKHLGHKHLVEHNYEKAIESYEASSDLYNEIMDLDPGGVHDQTQKQVNEWLMDVRDRQFTEEMRRLRSAPRSAPPGPEAPRDPPEAAK